VHTAGTIIPQLVIAMFAVILMEILKLPRRVPPHASRQQTVGKKMKMKMKTAATVATAEAQ